MLQYVSLSPHSLWSCCIVPDQQTSTNPWSSPSFVSFLKCVCFLMCDAGGWLFWKSALVEDKGKIWSVSLPSNQNMYCPASVRASEFQTRDIYNETPHAVINATVWLRLENRLFSNFGSLLQHVLCCTFKVVSVHRALHWNTIPHF